MSTSTISCTESPVWTPPAVYGELSRQPFSRNQFDATFNNLITGGILEGTRKELRNLFGHARPSLDTPLDLLHGPIKSYEKKMAEREKSVADTLRNFLACNFAETVQTFSVADQLAGQRASIGSAFLSKEDKKHARLMDPNQDLVAPEAAKTRVVSTMAHVALTDAVFMLRVTKRHKESPNQVILPSADDLGFEGFVAHGAPIMTAGAAAENRTLVAARKYLNAGNEAGVKPTEIALGSFLGCGTENNVVVDIPEFVTDKALNKFFMDAPTLEIPRAGVNTALGHLKDTGAPVIFPLISGSPEGGAKLLVDTQMQESLQESLIV